MGGLFGGLLGLFNVIGGVVLYFLIGAQAWRESNARRQTRAAIGGIFIGTVIGLALYLIWPLASDPLASFVASFVVLPGVFFIVSLILEVVRRKLG